MKKIIDLFGKLNEYFESRFDFWFMWTNRPLHFTLCLFGSVIFGFGFGVGAGLALEYKDTAYGGQPDVLDFLASLLGGLAGGLIHFYLYSKIMN